jgi:hypothetical protein
LGVTILKYFDADPESGMEKILIRDRYKVGSGIKHPRSATLLFFIPDPRIEVVHPFSRIHIKDVK